MKKVKCKVIGDGLTPETAFTVALPTWSMVGEIDKKSMTVEVLIADDETTNNKIDQQKIRKKYAKSWSSFNKLDVEAP